MDSKSDEFNRKLHVGDDENIFRLISYPGCIDEYGDVSPDAFSLYHYNEDYVSVY